MPRHTWTPEPVREPACKTLARRLKQPKPEAGSLSASIDPAYTLVRPPSFVDSSLRTGIPRRRHRPHPARTLPTGRGATAALVALVAALLLLSTATVGAVAEDTAAKTMEPKAPQYRPWRIYQAPKGNVLTFECAGDVPTLRTLPGSSSTEDVGDGNALPSTCGGAQARTPTQYRYSRPDKPYTGHSALYWTGVLGGDGEDGAGLMPAAKMQLIAIPKFVAAFMEAMWREEQGEAMPESVPFPADTVAFYNKGSLLIMGREDVEFREPPGVVDGKARPLALGTVM